MATENDNAASDDPFEKHINIAIEAQDGPSTETSNTGTESGEEAKGDEANKQSEPAKEGGDSGAGNTGTQQQPTKETKEEPKHTSGPKDLRLPDGTVVKAGAERRLYEQRETARQEAQHVRRELDTTRQELERVRNELQTTRSAVETNNGMPPEQLGIAARMFRDLQSDPVGTMKKLLAELVATGHTIEGIGAGVDQLAIQRIIDARLGNGLQQQEPSEEDFIRQAEEETSRFYSQYPDARPHDALIARALRDNPGMELHDVYFQLKNSFAERGFDWSRTLEDNLRESQQQQPTTTTTTTAPMLNGRTPPVSQVKVVDDVTVAHEDTDMGDIVRAAMRESGLKV